MYFLHTYVGTSRELAWEKKAAAFNGPKTEQRTKKEHKRKKERGNKGQGFKDFLILCIKTKRTRGVKKQTLVDFVFYLFDVRNSFSFIHSSLGSFIRLENKMVYPWVYPRWINGSFLPHIHLCPISSWFSLVWFLFSPWRLSSMSGHVFLDLACYI